MIVFHASNTIFDKFKISKKLSNSSLILLNEGYGIYMTKNKKLALCYGSILYTIEINKNNISDFTKMETLVDLIKNIENDCNAYISNYIDCDLIFNGLNNNGISILKLYKEINNILDSKEKFYDEYKDRITYNDDCLFDQIKNSFFKNIKDIIKYKNPDLKNDIYLCFRNEENLKIKEKICYLQ